MRPLSWIILGVAAVAIAALLFLHPWGGGGSRREQADSLARKADSISVASQAGTDTTVDFISSLVPGRSADTDTLLGIEDSLAKLAREDFEIRRTGPRPRPRPAQREDSADTGGPVLTLDMTASDSVTWLLRLDSLSQLRIAKLTVARTLDGREKVRLASERDAWRDRAGILAKQVVAGNAVTHAVAEVAKGCAIPVLHTACPEVGLGPGVTVGVASNSAGTGVGAALGLTLAVIFPLHKPR